MYGKIVEDKVEIVYELPREIVVDDRRIFNPDCGVCGLTELEPIEPREGFVGKYVAKDGIIVIEYEAIPEPVVEEIEEEPIAE